MSRRVGTARWYESQGRWQIKVQKNGVRKTFTSYVKGRKGQRIANEKADRWLDSQSTNPDITVRRLCEMYVDSRKSLGQSVQTLNALESFINKWLIPSLGHVKVSDVTLYQLQQIINTRYQERNASRCTLQNTRSIINALFRFANRYGIKTVDASLVEIPRTARNPERHVFSLDDLKVILTNPECKRHQVVSDDPYAPIYRFTALTGMRIGEVLALRWSDIEDDLIHVRRNVTILKTLNQGKTRNAERYIPITPMIQEELDRIPHRSRYIFNTDDLSVRIKTIQGAFKRYCEYHNLSAHNLHALRHSFVSLSDSVLPLNTVKSIVGHSEQMQTVGIYGHVIGNEMDIARDTMQTVFENVLNNKKESH